MDFEAYSRLLSRGRDLLPDRRQGWKKGKEAKGTKRYLRKKNSVACALLITLYSWVSVSSLLSFYHVSASLDGHEYMSKQELIDSAEASGLSRVPNA